MRQLQALRRRWQDAREWANYRAAMICCVLANIHRDKNQKAYRPIDFMPQEKRRPQTTEQMFQAVRMLHRAHGGD